MIPFPDDAEECFRKVIVDRGLNATLAELQLNRTRR